MLSPTPGDCVGENKKQTLMSLRRAAKGGTWQTLTPMDEIAAVGGV